MMKILKFLSLFITFNSKTQSVQQNEKYQNETIYMYEISILHNKYLNILHSINTFNNYNNDESKQKKKGLKKQLQNIIIECQLKKEKVLEKIHEHYKFLESKMNQKFEILFNFIEITKNFLKDDSFEYNMKYIISIVQNKKIIENRISELKNNINFFKNKIDEFKNQNKNQNKILEDFLNSIKENEKNIAEEFENLKSIEIIEKTTKQKMYDTNMEIEIKVNETYVKKSINLGQELEKYELHFNKLKENKNKTLDELDNKTVWINNAKKNLQELF